jgi:hypothetical protein
MSIENEIKKLRESIEGLTNAIIESKKPVITENRIDPEVQEISIEYKPAEKIAPVEEQSKIIKEVEIPNAKLQYNINKSKEDSKVTNDMVKQLGKDKMAAGVDRSKIKSIITSLAGPDASIADLDESNIEECYNKISELQPESK